MLFENGTVSALFFASIAMNLLMTILIAIFCVRTRQTKYIALLAFTLLATAYQVFSWCYHSSTELQQALFWLKWHSNTVTLLLIAYYLTFALWLDDRRFIKFTLVVAACGGALLVWGLLKPLPLRFDTISALQHISVFTTEKVAVVRGEPGIAGYFLHAYALSVIGLMMVMSVVTFVSRRRFYGFILLMVVLIQLTGAMIGVLIDNGLINLFYVAGFAVILIDILICFVLAIESLANTDSLYKELDERARLEHAITQLAEGFRVTDSERFYESMLRSLYELSGARYIFIGLKHDDTAVPRINTHCVMKDGVVIDNFSYTLSGTPCEVAAQSEVCVYSEGVARLFPEDKMLTDLQLESYIGTPLLGDGEVDGLLVLLHDTPFIPDKKLLQAIEIFAARATAEIRREQTEIRLRQMAYFDYGTQLPNQARLFEVLNSSYAHSQQDGTTSVMMLFDLDRFTEVNRNYGYDTGEHVLRVLGLRLGNYVGDDIFIARNAGDEFAVVLQNLTAAPEAATKIHWEAIRAIIRQPIDIEGIALVVDCSMGAVLYPNQTQNRYDVIRAAETALQQAKHGGRGSMKLFDPQQLAHLDRQREIERGLVIALQSSAQLSVAYQPKVTQHGQCHGAEALLRWEHPTQGFISPAEFIPVAENSALILKLGDWVINNVCGQLEAWFAQGLPSSFVVSVNVSALQFAEDDFVSTILDTVAKYQVKPANIEFELTETGLLQNMDFAVQRLNRLIEAGFSVSLDDFGTGYSSLSYLRELPLHVLKIDKSFVDKVHDESSAELIRSIISIGHHMDLRIVAEGTETSDQVDLLSEMGCEFFQGYYFSRPLPPHHFLNWCMDGRLSECLLCNL
ncbi:putative bifunctional diguanylate cyclase/phosphodiesterase [Alteromonas gilva]|uniref:GGDEF and EAL domain-containing protein n=1 Tax=Alteromonas gilva TaxID=2987522 RepID=A0ABT5KYV5_9ALTE|nr:GGDEF and EAL domain-containing protein [Alteromonas gilva]MDC8829813.1 GGDEF and EAL domain-containing protein [Alteromonas gilva]